jgi:hypothetical protein
MPVSRRDQPPPDDFSAVEWVVIGSVAAVLARMIFAVMAVVVALSVTAFLLALPFFLLDERRRRKSFGHPLWDSDVDLDSEPDVGRKAGPIGRDRPPDPARRH